MQRLGDVTGLKAEDLRPVTLKDIRVSDLG